MKFDKVQLNPEPAKKREFDPVKMVDDEILFDAIAEAVKSNKMDKSLSIYPVHEYEVGSEFYTFSNPPLDDVIPDDILRLAKKFPGVIIAGGSLRGLFDPEDEISDFDLFFTREDSFEELAAYMERKCSLLFKCPTGSLLTFSMSYDEDSFYKVQLIKPQLYTSMIDLISTFDLTACMAATDGTKVVCHRMFPRDVRRKITRLNQVTYPVATLNRLRKYEKKGYLVNSRVYRQFMELVSGMEYVDDQLRFYID